MKYIKTHKKESVLIGLGIMMLLFIIVFVKIFFFSENSNVYGNRLDGIDKVKISDDKLEKISSELQNSDQIENAKSYITGKIINVLVTVNASSDLDAMKTETGIILNNLNKDEKEFYDIEVILLTKEDSEIYPIIGYKGKSSTEFIWKQ